MSARFLAFLTLFLFAALNISRGGELEGGACPFCDRHVLERQKFYEDEFVVALYTHKPIFPGHCLVIPKRHVERFEELSHEELAQLMEVIKKVNVAVKTAFQTSSYIILQKNGSEVGQTVPHLHFHYIPRKAGDSSSIKFLLKMYVASWSKPIKEEILKEAVLRLKDAMPVSDLDLENF